jgi:hypothetical protein
MVNRSTQLGGFMDAANIEYERARGVAKLYYAMKEVKTYLKTMELNGHVPILARHQKIMLEIDSALNQRKVIFK